MILLLENNKKNNIDEINKKVDTSVFITLYDAYFMLFCFLLGKINACREGPSVDDKVSAKTKLQK